MNSRVLHAVQLQLQLLLTLGSVADASATSFVALRLPSFISSDMVLQRGYVMLTNSDGPHAHPRGFLASTPWALFPRPRSNYNSPLCDHDRTRPGPDTTGWPHV